MKRKLALFTAVALILAVPCGISGAVPSTTAPTASKNDVSTPWAPILDSALPEITRSGASLGSPSKGAFHGVVVDHTTGDVYAVLNKHGIWKSTDQGATFQEPTGLVTGFAMRNTSFNVDPAGRRIACFLVYGSGGITTDAGKTWTPFQGVVRKGFDAGAVDWEVTGGGTMLAILHEINAKARKLLLTHDSGATWIDLGTGFYQRGPLGAFDDKTLIAGRTGRDIVRSTDGGASWTHVADLPGEFGQVVYVRKGVGYLATGNGLLVTKDKGATWAIQGAPVKAPIGPYFGKDDNHFAVIGGAGAYETTDGGKTWQLVAPRARGYSQDYSYAWDPIRDIFYVAQHDRPAVKCVVAPATAPAGTAK
ncbi:MAG: hypothetical protein WC661_11510 [Opitutaceae bacterium]|jgi:photosystem II stability/assembly factor-like uncharacterized protein